VDGSAYQTVRSIITKVEVAESVSRHIATSFGNMITVYALGDRPGEITIGGLLFMEDCNQVNSGFDLLYDFYRNNRLTRRNAAMRIVIGSKVFRSLMRSIVFGGVDSAYGMAQFSLNFDYLPGRPDARAMKDVHTHEDMLMDECSFVQVECTGINGGFGLRKRFLRRVVWRVDQNSAREALLRLDPDCVTLIEGCLGCSIRRCRNVWLVDTEIKALWTLDSRHEL
jgi:hypothetical protein